MADGLVFRLGVKNLLNDDIRYIHTRPANIETFSLPGRMVWAGLEWEL